MPDMEYITRQEHNEFAKRIDDENKRQNNRLERVETSVEKINNLTVAIEKMTVSIGQMATEIQTQGKRLESIEAKPGKRWESIVEKIILMVVGGFVGYCLVRLGLG